MADSTAVVGGVWMGLGFALGHWMKARRTAEGGASLKAKPVYPPKRLTANTHSFSAAEAALRIELAAAYRVFAMLGWEHVIHTHITAKVPDQGEGECFLINPYGYMFDEITASSLVKVRANGDIVDPGPTGLGHSSHEQWAA